MGIPGIILRQFTCGVGIGWCLRGKRFVLSSAEEAKTNLFLGGLHNGSSIYEAAA